MSRYVRFGIVGLSSLLLAAGLSAGVAAQGERQAEPRRSPPPERQAEPRRSPPPERKAEPRQPAPPPRHAAPRRPVAVRGEVIFIGGYFYDPFFGPYPWWPRPSYRRYFPAYDYRAEVRIVATPKETAVYVDGFYAGIVDDFDGVFQKLLLPPGGHAFALHLEGYRTAEYNVYVRPGSTFTLRHTMERLPASDRSAPPPIASPIPPPPEGSSRSPRTPPVWVPPGSPRVPSLPDAVGFGTLEIRVQPVDADVRIDGQRWATSEPGRFIVQVGEGRHRVEVSRSGYLRYSTDVDVRDGQAAPMNISLPPEKP